MFWIDEVTAPAVCEYAPIGSGSIIWEGAARRIPDPDYDWDREQRSMLVIVGQHDLGGMWGQALFDEDLVFTLCVDERDVVTNDP